MLARTKEIDIPPSQRDFTSLVFVRPFLFLLEFIPSLLMKTNESRHLKIRNLRALSR